MYLYYTMIVMSLTTLLDKKSPLFSELCLQSEREFLNSRFMSQEWNKRYTFHGVFLKNYVIIVIAQKKDLLHQER